MATIFKSLKDPKLKELLAHGAVGVLPTDTVYGLVCVAKNTAAVTKLYSLKSRENKPGTLVADNIESLTLLGIKRSYLKAVEQFWPGPISVVVPFSEPSGDYLRQGLPDIAARLPANKELVTFLASTGPLLTTSANTPGKKPASNIREAQDYFGSAVDFYVDGGSLKDQQASTIIRIVDDAVEVLRQGSVKIENNGVAK